MTRFQCLVAAMLLSAGPQLGAAGLVSFEAATRPVTPVEAADGAPSDYVIYQFFTTTDADILSVNQVRTELSAGAEIYIHPSAFGRYPPFTAFLPFFPGISASSWVNTPGSTSRLGPDLPGDGIDTTFGDLSNNGPQSHFQFAQMTIPPNAMGVFRGQISVAGANGPEDFPFHFAWGIPEPSAVALVVAGLFAVGAARGTRKWNPKSYHPIRRGGLTSLKSEIARMLRFATVAGHLAVAAGCLAPAFSSAATVTFRSEYFIWPGPDAAVALDSIQGQFHFVTTDADIVGVASVSVTGAMLVQYSPPFGSDTSPPDPAFVAINRALEEDSWITTPGLTTLSGPTLPGDGATTMFSDGTDDGPQTDFKFASLSTKYGERGRFHGQLVVAGTAGLEFFPFDFRVGPVPEPTTGSLAALLAAICAFRATRGLSGSGIFALAERRPRPAVGPDG